jgi:hypothetical protein
MILLILSILLIYLMKHNIEYIKNAIEKHQLSSAFCDYIFEPLVQAPQHALQAACACDQASGRAILGHLRQLSSPSGQSFGD